MHASGLGGYRAHARVSNMKCLGVTEQRYACSIGF